MDMIERLPAMDDAGLQVLHSNAERLQQSGTAAQRKAAAALMPAIEAELESRRAAKLEAAKAKRATTKRATTAKRATAKGAATKGAAPADA